MSKATLASLEAALATQRADFDAQKADLEAAFTTQVELTADLAKLVSELSGAVAVLNGRLNKASDAFKQLRDDVVSRQSSAPVSRMPTKAQQPNLWFVALAQLRAEFGLADGAFVARDDVMARMAELRAETQGSAAA